MINFLKVISGLVLIVAGFMWFRYNKKSTKENKKSPHSDLFFEETVSFQNYIVSIVLILAGLGLILSSF